MAFDRTRYMREYMRKWRARNRRKYREYQHDYYVRYVKCQDNS